MQTKIRYQWQKIHLYRFEFLLLSLCLVLFNKIFFPDQDVYVRYVWPVNMILLGLASRVIFKEEHIRFLRWSKNTLFLGSVLIPLFAGFVFSSKIWSITGILVYISYYIIILTEVLRQITRRGEINLSVILGSLCGYLLLIIIATFSFLITEIFVPGSFSQTNPENIPVFYNQMSYFSMITIATVGYGDITPLTDSARLLASFFGIMGQFYMVTLVGILISKFT